MKKNAIDYRKDGRTRPGGRAGLSACIFCRLRQQKDTASIPCAAYMKRHPALW
jgi:hypothetical protein